MPRREQYMWPSGQIYEEAVSQLKLAELHGIFGKRSASEYTQSENHVGKLTGATAQYMWRVSDEYTKKPFLKCKVYSQQNS